MNANSFRLAIASAVFTLASATSQAQVINFEGTTTNGGSRQLDVSTAGSIPSNFGPSLIDYAGYNWLGMYVNKPLISVNKPGQITGTVLVEDDPGVFITEYTTTPVDTGFHRSLVSGDTVAYTLASGSSTFGRISKLSGAQNFDFLSTYLTSAYRDDISVSVVGKRGGVSVYSQTLTVSDDGPTLYNLNFRNIDTIEFTASGGSFLYPNGTTVGSYLNPSNAFSSPVLVFDNISVAPVPEPGSVAMMLAGLIAVGTIARRRRAN